MPSYSLYSPATFHCHVMCNLAHNLAVIRREPSLLVSRGTSCLKLFHPSSTAALRSPSTVHSTSNRIYPLTPYTSIDTGAGWLIYTDSMYRRLAHFAHATLYATTFLVHPFLTVASNISTTNTTWLSSHILFPIFCTRLQFSALSVYCV